MRNVEPSPTLLSTSIAPPCALTMPWLTDKPRPVPLPTSFEVKNGSKMRCRFFSGMPQPVSMIEISTIGTGAAPGSGLLGSGTAAAADGDAALVRDRVLGVDQHVHDDLLDQVRVDPDLGQVADRDRG